MNTTSVHSAWIEKDLRPRFPHLADKAVEVYEIYEHAVSSGDLGSSDLLRLEEFCYEKSSMLRDCAASAVGSLSDTFSPAGDLLLKLVKTGRADVGVSAVAALHDLKNVSLKERVVRFGLRHRSKNVRELAACKAQRFRLYQVLGELEEVLVAEKNEKCRKNLYFSFALLRDGHLVENVESDSVRITVAGPRSVSGQTFSKELVEEKGLQKLIDELKARAKF